MPSCVDVCVYTYMHTYSARVFLRTLTIEGLAKYPQTYLTELLKSYVPLQINIVQKQTDTNFVLRCSLHL